MTPSTPRRSSLAENRAVVDRPGEHGHAEGVAALDRRSRDQPVVERRRGHVRLADDRLDAERKGQAQARAHRPEDGHEAAPPETEPARRIRPAERQAGLEPPQSSQLAETVGARHRSPDEVVASAGPRRTRARSPAALHVCQEPGLGAPLGEEGEDVLQGRRLFLELAVRVAEDERAVGPPEDVELHHVHAERQSGLDRGDRVRRGERRCATMPDPQQRAVPRRSESSRRRRQRVLLEAPAAGCELEDHPVRDPLDGRTVVRPRVGRGPGDLQVSVRAGARAAEAEPGRAQADGRGAPSARPGRGRSRTG